MQSRFLGMGLLIAFAAFAGRSSDAWGFDPENGVWSKGDQRQVRVMTWNVGDAIGIGVDTTPASPTVTGSAYDYVGRICQALAPDVICFQEVDPAGNYYATVDVMEQWVATYFGAGAYYVAVSTQSDGYNRNVILSKFPFADVDGDGQAIDDDMPYVDDGPGGVPPGGDGGIRGWLHAEVDLPDIYYLGDLWIGNSHLKAYGDADAMQQRLAAAQNMAYYINEVLNGGGDAWGLFSSIFTNPLSPTTPVVIMGDYNEDELTNGRDGPVMWLTEWTSSPNDGTDRDGSEMRPDSALQLFTTNRATRGATKLDYILVQDSIATVVEEFVFRSNEIPPVPLPPQLQGIRNGAAASSYASDHFPVIVDLDLPLHPPVPGDTDGDRDVDVVDFEVIHDCMVGPGQSPSPSPPRTPEDCLALVDFDEDGDVDAADYGNFQAAFSVPRVIYVDADATGANDGSSWTDAFTDLQDALDEAIGVDQIWVAEGVYKPDRGSGNRAETFEVLYAVEMYGGFAGGETALDERDWRSHEAVLSGDIGVQGGAADNSSHVVTIDGPYADPTLDGLVIRGGFANGVEPFDRGAGIYHSGGALTLRNTVVEDCFASFNGGAIILRPGSSLSAEACLIRGNRADNNGGGMMSWQATAEYVNCAFSGNQAGNRGGAVQTYQADSTFVNCSFVGNHANDDADT